MMQEARFVVHDRKKEPSPSGKSGSLSALKHFAFDLREIVRRQTLPGYQLVITRDPDGVERLQFTPLSTDPLAERLRKRGLALQAGDKL